MYLQVPRLKLHFPLLRCQDPPVASTRRAEIRATNLLLLQTLCQPDEFHDTNIQAVYQNQNTLVLCDFARTDG